MTQRASSERTRLKRRPNRAVRERADIETILDEAIVCHLGFVHDGHPVVIPTLSARDGDHVYVHGSAASRMLTLLGKGIDACLTVTLVDGLVLARSAFHHSVNYRSAMVFGRADVVSDRAEKQRALEVLTEKLAPGRWAEVRLPTAVELKATAVLRLPLDEMSAKVRTGPPVDDEADYGRDVWAGVVPFEQRRLAPEADPRLGPAVVLPDYLRPG